MFKGFHHVLPTLLAQTAIQHVQCYIENDEPLQSNEVRKRFLAEPRVVLAATSSLLQSHTAMASHDGLVLLMDGGASAWRKLWFEVVEMWLRHVKSSSGTGGGSDVCEDGGTARVDAGMEVDAKASNIGAAGAQPPHAFLSIMFESSSEIAKEIFDDICAAARVLGLLFSCDKPHEIFSLSHRYVFQNFLFSPASLESIEWPVLVYPELNKKSKKQKKSRT